MARRKDNCCCDPTYTGDWVEIHEQCPTGSNPVYYITLAECEAMTPGDCSDKSLFYNGFCYSSGAVHYESTTTLPHFPGAPMECSAPSCFDLIFHFEADSPTCGAAPLVCFLRVPGETYPGFFSSDGCTGDATTEWDGKFGIMCPATIDTEPCCQPDGTGCSCHQEFAEEWGNRKSPRGAVFYGLVDTICKNDTYEGGGCDFDPDDFAWYDIDDQPAFVIGFSECCYEELPPEFSDFDCWCNLL